MLKPVNEIVAAAKEKSHCVSPDEAKNLINELYNAIILDVREPAEVANGHIEGSVNIPRGLLEMKIADVCPDANTPIFIHCAAGGRAALCATTLQDMGYTDVYVIDAMFEHVSQCFS